MRCTVYGIAVAVLNLFAKGENVKSASHAFDLIHRCGTWSGTRSESATTSRRNK
jgi:hypothetical protein